MGLTILKVRKLEDFGYIKYVYEKDISGWLKEARKAYDHVKEVMSKGEEPWADDLLPFLIPAVAVQKEFHDYEIKEGPRGEEERQRLCQYFAEYVIEKFLRPKK